MMNTFKAATFGAIALLAAPAMADTVTITTPDNSVNVTGELVGFNGAEYIVLSSVGIVSLNADAVICEGSACSKDFSIASLEQATPLTAAQK